MKDVLFVCVILYVYLFVGGVDCICKDTTYPLRVHNSTNYSIAKSQVFKVGVAGSFGLGINFCWLVFKLVTDVLNNSSDILPDVRLDLYLADVMLSDSNAVIATQYLIENIEVKTIIGGITTSETGVTQLFSRVNKIPQVIPLSTSSQFTSRFEYPFVARVVPNDIQQAVAIACFLEKQGWKQILFLYGGEESGVSGLELLKAQAFNRNITIYSYQIPSDITDFNTTVNEIGEMVKRYRIRIFAHYETFGTANIFFPAFIAAGYTGPKYAQIFAYSTAVYCMTYPSLYSWCWGGVGIVPRDGTGPIYDEYLARWNNLRNTTGWISNPRLAWYFADAVLAVAHSLDNVMKRTGLSASEINGTMHMDAFENLNFLGITGNISLDDNLERRGSYNWFNFGKNHSQSAVNPVAYYNGETGETNISRTIYFVDGVTLIHDGYCVCHFGTCDEEDRCICQEGFIGLSCNEKVSKNLSKTGMILVIVLPIIVTAIIALFGVRYIQIRKERMIKELTDKQKSIIKRKDIQLDKPIGRGASGVVFKGMYRGTEVAVKGILVNDVSSSSMQEFEFESAVMAGLRHPNIVIFIGSCMDPVAKEMLIVMEFLEKGSLHDVLHNSKIVFPFEMALHVASQAAKGMNFLHQASPPIIHRDLKSHNILLDDKWNARIADFGITRMKDLTNKKRKEKKSLGTIFWTAPEVFQGNCNTEKSDCYSFGIVMWELVHRVNPYEGRAPMAVALEVCSNSLRPTIFVPMVPEYEQLMKDCWAQLPDDRPSFQEISQRLRQMNGNYTSFPKINNNGAIVGVERQTEAPEGNVIFVQTEITSGNIFWDQCPNDMLESIQIHTQLLRHQLKTYEGYEVESGEIDDSFLIAFEDASNAINFCISFQLGLLRVSWPNAITSLPEGAKFENSVGEVVWNGLRVRMAVSSGVPNSEIDPSTGRTKYFGTAVDKVKRMLATSPTEASIVTSELIADLINQNTISLGEPVILTHCGKMPETISSKLNTVYSILPAALESRSTIDSYCSHSVVDINDVTLATTQNNPPLSWIFSSSDFLVKESVGRGAVGDYYRAQLNENDIAVKYLINQKLEERDLLNIKATVSQLCKIAHENLVEIYGVCFDAGQISLLMEYIPQSGLRNLLSNESISISYPNKLKIAKQIADGMAYLSTMADPEISIFGNLKSGNILVNSETFNVKISDYGQGILKDLGRTMTSVGTVAWTAPEILMGEETTKAISVYSFGIILYEIFTRKVPFANNHPVQLVGEVIEGLRPPCANDIPLEYKELMERCWAAVPSERPEWSFIANQLSNMLASAN